LYVFHNLLPSFLFLQSLFSLLFYFFPLFYITFCLFPYLSPSNLSFSFLSLSISFPFLLFFYILQICSFHSFCYFFLHFFFLFLYSFLPKRLFSYYISLISSISSFLPFF
jgi:hypothetical protein